MGLTTGTSPFGKKPAGTFNFEARSAQRATRSTSSHRPGAFAGSSAARRSSIPVTSHCCSRRATCRSGTSRARMCASTCSRRPSTRRIARSRATRATGRSARAERSPRTRSGAYDEILPETPPITDRVAFYWDAVEHWYEEDEEIFVHPRDPYHRVDLVPSSRLRARVAGRRRAGRVEPARGLLRDRPCRRAGTSRRDDVVSGYEALAAHHALPVQGHRVVLERRRQRRHRLELRGPGGPPPRRCEASSRSTTRSSTSTSTASARSAATRRSRCRRRRPGANA